MCAYCVYEWRNIFINWCPFRERCANSVSLANSVGRRDLAHRHTCINIGKTQFHTIFSSSSCYFLLNLSTLQSPVLCLSSDKRDFSIQNLWCRCRSLNIITVHEHLSHYQTACNVAYDDDNAITYNDGIEHTAIERLICQKGKILDGITLIIIAHDKLQIVLASHVYIYCLDNGG